jgi:hypothetical protein
MKWNEHRSAIATYIESRGLSGAIFRVPAKLGKELYLCESGKSVGVQQGQWVCRASTWKKLHEALVESNISSSDLVGKPMTSQSTIEVADS